MVQSQYFGDYTLYKKLYKLIDARISLYDPYQKSAHSNRTNISGANGIIKLNIPLIGGREQRLPLSSVRVSYAENWRTIHLRSIVSSYKRSPWFDHFADDLTVFYKNDWEHLRDWNLASIRWILTVLKFDLQLKWVYVSEPGDIGNKNELPAETTVEASTVRPYPQVFEDRFGFIPGLSILDTLFCLGPKSTKEYIMGG